MERLFGRTSFGKISYLYRKGEHNLVFLHGLGGSSNNWMRLVKYLDEDYSLYFLDLLGHGRTGAGKWNYTVKEQCSMLSEFLDECGISKFGLVGNSYGGWISAAYAAKVGKPEILILEDSAGINPTVGESDTDKMEKFIDRLQSFGRTNDREIMKKIIVENSTGAEKLSTGDLASIRARTMVIWGDRDRIIDPRYGRELSEQINGSTFEIIKDAGHVPHYTHPEKTASLINSFSMFESV